MDGVWTATGFVTTAQMGYTLPHEHVFMVLEGDRQVDYGLMREELGAFTAQGGKTLVDLTTAEISVGACPDPGGAIHPAPSNDSVGGRNEANVLALRDMARDTGLNIVVGTGHYRDPFLSDEWFDRYGVDAITERLIADIENGIGDTGVRAGIIGEIGADKWYISAAEERSFRASARAQKRTGVSISTHAAWWPVGLAQLDLLCAEGVDSRRVIIGHCDSVNIPEYHEEIARRGAFVQFDTIRTGPSAIFGTEYDLRLRVGFVLNMVEKGFGSQLLLSHDICRRSQLHIHGSGGYDFIATTFSRALLDAGLDAELLQQILVANPQRALTAAGE